MRFETIHVIGCGGIGSWLLPPLAKFLDSLDSAERPKLVLWDGDRVEEHNCVRQNFYPSDVGAHKAELLARATGDIYDNLDVDCQLRYCGAAHMREFENSLVLAGPDNHKCRDNILNWVAVDGGNSAVIGGNEKSDGTVLYFGSLGAVEQIRERFPEIEAADDGDRAEMSCAELAALPGGEQTMVANFMCAAIMFQHAVTLLTNATKEPPIVTYFDCIKGTQRTIEEE
ncbi:MAG: ThiF family adenylyltransferase [Planctomycetes bacterium]|jgi:molybdopterin/thiamine biosynthesis adenylyltransferase|nr:ThiF family adenylyltransferase [Planctomycetota bacterium]